MARLSKFSLCLNKNTPSRAEKDYTASRDGQFDYNDKAIEIMITIMEVFHLTNRGVEGFVLSVFQRMNIALPVPDHSTLSKRGKTLKVKLPRKTGGSLNLVLDSTGMKIYGGGKWKVRKHGNLKHRTWRRS